ncbi:hypothetical protein [Microbacterium sp.]|uniref:hypothetical protein n=1 Tax=Microbacterium sp. TaxID=51671 RepID=UPI002E318BE3|nr:hypothetical protein [Microbacterium sp.]HEX5728189.1 hypothetical protein [Microbacterium sp.]
MAVPEGRARFYIIRTERQSWLLLVVGIVLAAASLLLYVTVDPGVGQLIMTILLAAVAVYSAVCVMWHRRHPTDQR